MHPNADNLIASRFDTVIYDLDGTLIDSAKDMQVAVSRVLADHGRPPVTEDDVRILMGQDSKVTMDKAAIPWVLLSAKTTPGPDGDRLVDTSFIQRLDTTGGLTPPAADCNAATANTVVEVPYTAEYVFWKHTAA